MAALLVTPAARGDEGADGYVDLYLDCSEGPQDIEAPLGDPNYVPGCPINSGIGQLQEYVRCGEIIALNVGNGIDWDHHTAPPYGPPPPGVGRCGWCGRAWGKQDVVVNPPTWDDNGASGGFGHFNANNVFVYGEPHTHYLAGADPGVVTLTARFEDQVLWADDLPLTDSRSITVWDFRINDAGPNWEPNPAGAPFAPQMVPFMLTISPAIDHNGHSMAATITATLATSEEPGYCLNMTHASGGWDDTGVGRPDLAIPPTIPNTYRWNVDAGLTRATTMITEVEVPLEVACLDFGAFGGLSATATWPTIPGVTGRPQYAEVRVMDQWGVDTGRAAVSLPYDDLPAQAGNHIADGGTGSEFNAVTAHWDGELAPGWYDALALPSGKGDGWSAYDEYRGFIIDGGHRRLHGPGADYTGDGHPGTPKEILVYNPSGLPFARAEQEFGYILIQGLSASEVALEPRTVASGNHVFTLDAARVRRYYDGDAFHVGACDWAAAFYNYDHPNLSSSLLGGTNVSGELLTGTVSFVVEAHHTQPGKLVSCTVAHELGHVVDLDSPPLLHVDALNYAGSTCLMGYHTHLSDDQTALCTRPLVPDPACVTNHSILRQTP